MPTRAWPVSVTVSTVTLELWRIKVAVQARVCVRCKGERSGFRLIGVILNFWAHLSDSNSPKNSAAAAAATSTAMLAPGPAPAAAAAPALCRNWSGDRKCAAVLGESGDGKLRPAMMLFPPLLPPLPGRLTAPPPLVPLLLLLLFTKHAEDFFWAAEFRMLSIENVLHCRGDEPETGPDKGGVLLCVWGVLRLASLPEFAMLWLWLLTPALITTVELAATVGCIMIVFLLCH